MKIRNQNIFNFAQNKSFNYEDYFVSKSNYFAYGIINKWPKWEKNILNIYGESFSGKTHLSKIFLNKNKGIIIYEKDINDKIFQKLKLYENIIMDNFNHKIDEKLLYSIFNFIDNENKYLVINSINPINEYKYKLKDLKSRAKNCLFAKIEIPDDELMNAIIFKNFSDRQINIDSKLIDYIAKRIDRSYSKISQFIYKIDELSLKKKKPIDFKIIKEILKKGE
tara:strand:- start:4094 stop:4762 length:669 start_codon:yes stop_codon:yes gene_type:complete